MWHDQTVIPPQKGIGGKFARDKLTGPKRVLWCGQLLWRVWWILMHDVRKRNSGQTRVVEMGECRTRSPLVPSLSALSRPLAQYPKGYELP